LLTTGITFSQRHGDQVEDVTNKYDTDDTVKQITLFDLVHEQTCPEAEIK